MSRNNNAYMHVSLPNEISSGNATAPSMGNGLGPEYQVAVESIQTMPSWITRHVFNSIYAFGIVTNILLLVYLISYKRYKTPVFCVILSLAFADLGMCVGGLILYSVISPFIRGPLWLGNVTVALSQLSYLVSSYHIAVFAVLRFLQLVYPLASHAKVTTSLMFKICLTIWIAHSIQAGVISSRYEPVNVSTVESNAMYVLTYMGDAYFFMLWIIIVWGVVPFVVTSGFHVAKQLIVLFPRTNTVVTSQNERVQQVRRQTDSRALAIVIVTYLLTMFPFIVQAFRVYVFNVPFMPIELYLVNTFGQLAYINSAINPWIYMISADTVRSDIRKMLTCIKN